MYDDDDDGNDDVDDDDNDDDGMTRDGYGLGGVGGTGRCWGGATMVRVSTTMTTTATMRRVTMMSVR